MTRILRDADLQPHRQQMYLTSHDDELREKRSSAWMPGFSSTHTMCSFFRVSS